MYGGCQPPSRSSQWSLRVAVRGASSPPRSSQRSLRVAAKAASFNSLAHWASASLFPPLAALGSAPRPAFKKAGENWLESFLGFPTAYAGPPLTGSGGLVLWVGFRGGKRLANGSLGLRKIPASPGGRRRAQSALKERRPGPPRFCLAAGAALRAPRPAKRRRPPGDAGIFANAKKAGQRPGFGSSLPRPPPKKRW